MSNQLKSMPIRSVQVGGEGAQVNVEDYGVAVVGNAPTSANAGSRGQATAYYGGAAIAGDGAAAVSSKDCVALAGQNGEAGVGDGGMARSSSGGFAVGAENSVARVDDDAWAVSIGQGIALARAGLAQTMKHGVAGAFTRPSIDGGFRGIAITGPAGIALAFSEGVLVKAGVGGALAGFWDDGGETRLSIRAIDPDSGVFPDTFYRFSRGEFVKLTSTETQKADSDLTRWKTPWLAALDQAIERNNADGQS